MNKYLFTIKWYIFLSILLFCMESVFMSLMLYLPGHLIDNYTKGRMYVVFLVTIYLILFFLYLLICYISNRVADYRRIKFEKSIRIDFFNSVIKRNFDDFYKYSSSEYISMQSNDIAELCQNYLSPFISLFRSFTMIVVFGFALIFFVNLYIAVFILAFSIIAVFIPHITATELSKRKGRYLHKVGQYTSIIKDFFEARDIFDNKCRLRMQNIHQEVLNDVFTKNMRFRRLNSFAIVLNGGSVEFISVFVFFIVALLLVKEQISLGMISVAFMYSNKFIEPLFEFNLNLGRVKSIREIKDKLLQIIEYDPYNNKIEINHVKNIVIQNVKKNMNENKIKYPEFVFKNCNKYLITGENGVGKSVLFKILMNFYEQDSGIISYNDIDIKKIDVESINAYLPQKTQIFNTSYYNNVTFYGAYSKKKLSLYESYFPNKIIQKMKLNKTIATMSGGELQIISIIRALCSEKPVLLFDEPFSAMNSKTIKYFMDNIHRIKKIIVIVSHKMDDYVDNFDHVWYLN